MRRLLVVVAGLGLLHGAAGCQHVAGFCDCAPPVKPCCIYGLYPADYAIMPVAASAAQPEPPPAVPPGPETVPPPAATPPAGVTPPMGAPPMAEPVKERIGLPREL